MERYQDEKALGIEELKQRNLQMIKDNRFLSSEEKDDKIKRINQAQSVDEIKYKAILKNPSFAMRGRGAFVKMALKKLDDIDPGALKECYDLSQPKILDHDLIPFIIDEAANVYPKNFENYPILLAVCYYLIAPFKNIHQDIKLEVGIRDKLAQALGFANPESVNAYSAYIIPSFKNPRWKAKIVELADQVYTNLMEVGLIK